MSVELITKEDLQEFRHQLLDDLKQIINSNPQEQKQWLKSYEVKKLLKISSGTLQNLRINGTLSYTKIGSIIYYSYEDIEKLLDENKSSHPQKRIPFNERRG
jgi:Helix-turn-helix domain